MHIAEEVTTPPSIPAPQIEADGAVGGVWLKDMKVGESVTFSTRNIAYTLEKVDRGLNHGGRFTIVGHPHLCPIPTPAVIIGSAWGGSLLKGGFIGVGLSVKMVVDGSTQVTTPVQRLQWRRAH